MLKKLCVKSRFVHSLVLEKVEWKGLLICSKITYRAQWIDEKNTEIEAI